MSDTISNPYDREAAERAVNHVPPHSLQLERAVLGLMLLSPAATDEIIASDLRPGVFYSPTHQHLYDTIVSLNAKGSAVDVLTVAEALGAEFLEMVDGRRWPGRTPRRRRLRQQHRHLRRSAAEISSVAQPHRHRRRAPTARLRPGPQLTLESPSTTPKSDYSR